MRRFFGLEGDFGKLLGVDNDWSYRIVKDIGNYGEVYEATFGAKGLGLPRGMNNLYDKGGLQTAADLALSVGQLTAWSGGRRHAPAQRNGCCCVGAGGGRLVLWLHAPRQPRAPQHDLRLRLPRRSRRTSTSRST